MFSKICKEIFHFYCITQSNFEKALATHCAALQNLEFVTVQPLC